MLCGESYYPDEYLTRFQEKLTRHPAAVSPLAAVLDRQFIFAERP